MKKLFFAAGLVLSVLCFSSCHCKKKSASTDTAAGTTSVVRDFEKEGYVKGTVIFYEMDACKYLIMLPNEDKLEPSPPLAAEFQKDKLDVWVKYSEKKGAMSACMAGKVVTIADIQLRK